MKIYVYTFMFSTYCVCIELESPCRGLFSRDFMENVIAEDIKCYLRCCDTLCWQMMHPTSQLRIFAMTGGERWNSGWLCAHVVLAILFYVLLVSQPRYGSNRRHCSSTVKSKRSWHMSHPICFYAILLLPRNTNDLYLKIRLNLLSFVVWTWMVETINLAFSVKTIFITRNSI